MQQPNEVWKDVEGYEGLYQVSSLGRIRSLDRVIIVKGKIMSPVNRNGYSRIRLKKDGKGQNFSIHRLVASAFLPNPKNLPEVNHKNEIKTDNSVENLEWCSTQYNCNYGTKIKRQTEKISKRVLQISTDGEIMGEYKSASEVERLLGYKSSRISECCNGKRQTAFGYKWRFV